MNFSDFFAPPPPPAVSTGISTETGVSIGKEPYTNAPKVTKNAGSGQSVGIVKEGRIPVILFTGGFHTP